MNITRISTRKERREQAKELTVSTHHHGVFGVWAWEVLSQQEKDQYLESQRRNQHVSLFGIYDNIYA